MTDQTKNDRGNQIQKAYKTALLHHDTEAINKNRATLESRSDTPSNFFNDATQWFNKAQSIVNQAVALAEAGESCGSLSYDTLAKQAHKLGNGADSFMRQKFKQASMKFQQQRNASKPKSNQQPANAASKESYLNNIQKFASWGDKYSNEVKNNRSELLRFYPNATEEADAAIKKGKALKRFIDDASKLGTSGNPETDLNRLLDQMRLKNFNDYERNIARKSYNGGAARRKRGIEQSKFRKQRKSQCFEKVNAFDMKTDNLAPSQHTEIHFNGIHPNSLTQLAPATRWTVLIDETGSEFAKEAFDPQTRSQNRGRMVALFVPEDTTLPDLPANWHATTQESFTAIHDTVLSVRNSRCGVLGIPICSLYEIDCELWFSGIETLLDLALRLLPIQDDTYIDLYVEQRANATPDRQVLLEKTCADVLHRLSRSDAFRAGKIHIQSRIIRKTDHPWNGYVDTVAYTWSNSDLLKESQWLHSCFIGIEPDTLRRALDVMEREDRLTPEEWRRLLTSDDGEISNSLVFALLRILGEHAQSDSEFWMSYVNDTLAHLDSKAIDLTSLNRQIHWLKTWEPDNALLPPRLRLLWLTAQLADENHRGNINSFKEHRSEFHKLSERLFVEDAPLVCNAALHLAVSHTNEFDFKTGKGVLEFWRNLPPEVPGRRFYAQLLSSFGQYEAFTGNNNGATVFFKRAIEEFEKLSDSHIAKLDISQTTAYLLTAMSDDPMADVQERDRYLSRYFGEALETTAKKLAVSNAPCDKYRHHLLLRYLHAGQLPERIRATYIAHSEQWQIADGHPWEMIEFYRALLLDNMDERLKRLRSAYKIAQAGGGTLRVIAAVILGSILLDDSSVSEEYASLVDAVDKSLPKLGNRLSILREQPSLQRTPLDLASAVLPFNFR